MHLSHEWYLINSHVFLFRLDLILAFFEKFFFFVFSTNFSVRGCLTCFDDYSFIKVISFAVGSKLIFWILIKRSTLSIRKLHTSEYKELVIRTQRKIKRQPLSTMPHITLSSHFARKCCGRVRAIAFNVLSLRP